MLIKKFGSLLLALTLMVACIPGTMATAADAGWYEIEAEAADTTGTTATADGNTYIYAEQGGADSAVNVTFAFNAQAETYDIWALIGLDNTAEPASPRMGKYEFYLNDEETPFGTRLNNNLGVDWTDGGLYTTRGFFNNAGFAQKMYWVKVGTKALNGDTTIRVEFQRISNHTYGIIDKIRVVPASWNHTPTDITTLPVPPVVEVTFDSFTLTDKAAGATATATVAGIKKAIDAEKTAVVIIAVYQGDALVSVAPSAVTALTAVGQTISANVTLPEDLTGVTVKAFLWDGLATGNAYCLPIDK